MLATHHLTSYSPGSNSITVSHFPLSEFFVIGVGFHLLNVPVTAHEGASGAGISKHTGIPALPEPPRSVKDLRNPEPHVATSVVHRWKQRQRIRRVVARKDAPAVMAVTG